MYRFLSEGADPIYREEAFRDTDFQDYHKNLGKDSLAYKDANTYKSAILRAGDPRGIFTGEITNPMYGTPEEVAKSQRYLNHFNRMTSALGMDAASMAAGVQPQTVLSTFPGANPQPTGIAAAAAQPVLSAADRGYKPFMTLDEGQNLSVAEQSELIRYLNLTDSWRKGLSEEDQSKLDTAKDAFLPNVSTTEGGGIGDFEDEYIQNILARVQGNPDLTFMQSLGIGVPDDYLSQTEAMKLLGKTGVASLQAFNPETYYGDVDQGGFGFKPRTQAELEALAKLDISSDGPYAGNKGLIREIARAREELRRQKGGGGGGDNQQAGIPSVVPPPVTPPGAPQPPIVPFPPFMPTLPFPPLVKGAPQFNYGAFPQFNLSTYAQQGIADPNLAAFYQNLGRIA